MDGVVFPNGYYMQYIEDQLHSAGIVVPLVSNDASPNGYNAPGTGIGEVDIYVSVFFGIEESLKEADCFYRDSKRSTYS